MAFCCRASTNSSPEVADDSQLQNPDSSQFADYFGDSRLPNGPSAAQVSASPDRRSRPDLSGHPSPTRILLRASFVLTYGDRELGR